MQAGVYEQGFPHQDSSPEAAGKMTGEFSTRLNLAGDSQDHSVTEEEKKDEEFTFVCGENTSTSPVFPLFNRDLLFSEENLPLMPPVKKVFVETEEGDGNMMSSSLENNDMSGSVRNAVEASSEFCKKSNSTGFSKIWRFKDFMGRCNSDGRDAFVFLNRPSKAAPPPTVVGSVKMEHEVGGGEKKESTVKGKKNKKGKMRSSSAHEVYLKNKAKEGDRKRSYLPYRPELMGFFTSVSGGGLTRNVHPF